MIKLLRFFFFLIVVRLLVLIVIGLRIVHKERLPTSGPAIIAANHNSHLDTFVLMTLFPIQLLDKVRPVAAEDYFCQNRFLSWFTLNIIGIIPLNREIRAGKFDPLLSCYEALEKGEILIIYPEGSRGKPESLAELKTGIAHLAKHYPEIPIYPIFLHGLGKCLPKGEALFVPFFCDVSIDEPIFWGGKKKDFMELLTQRMQALAAQGNFPAWE
jgi:1-acyl-sn-glycerol-3-phosphate acyltransferase